MLIKIKRFPSYEITEDGEVFNKRGHKIKPELTRNGYLRVSLNNDSEKHKRMSVHRLVAEAYIPNPNGYPQVNHKDENKQNNNVSNLEWSTPLHNLNHSSVIDKASIAKFHKVKCEETGEVFDSIKEACEKYGLYHANIVACCAGRRNKCGGLTWSYLT